MNRPFSRPPRSSSRSRTSVSRDGALSPEQVTHIIKQVTGGPTNGRQAPVDVKQAGKVIRPRTAGQAEYVEAIRTHDLVFCSGPAGTGKTYLAVATAVESLKQKQIGKIVLVRPAVEAGENLGFLPGDMQAKINPYLRPLLDALREMMDYEQVKRYMAEDVIEVVPLAYMRGRTLNNAFIIMDEAQNTTVPQMKMFLTRMGLQFESRRVGRYVASRFAVAHEKRPDRRDRPAAGHRRLRQRGADARGYRAASVGAGDCSLLRGRTQEETLKQHGAGSKEQGVRISSDSMLPAPSSQLYHHEHRQQKEAAHRSRHLGGVAARRAGQSVGAFAPRPRAGAVGAVRDYGSAAVGLTRGWAPALPYHRGDFPRRDIVARTQFEREDPEATDKARKTARSLTIATYDQDPSTLEQLRAKVENEVTELVAAKSLAKVDKLWDSIPAAVGRRHTGADGQKRRQQQYQKFRETLSAEGALDKFKAALNEAFDPLLQKGVLEKLPGEHDANAETISVHLVGTEAKFRAKSSGKRRAG